MHREKRIMEIEVDKAFSKVKKIQFFSYLSRWLLRSVPLQQQIENKVVVYFKQRKDTIYLIAIENTE